MSGATAERYPLKEGDVEQWFEGIIISYHVDKDKHRCISLAAKTAPDIVYSRSGYACVITLTTSRLRWRPMMVPARRRSSSITHLVQRCATRKAMIERMRSVLGVRPDPTGLVIAAGRPLLVKIEKTMGTLRRETTRRSGSRSWTRKPSILLVLARDGRVGGMQKSERKALNTKILSYKIRQRS